MNATKPTFLAIAAVGGRSVICEEFGFVVLNKA
jgi:hypothetical protein